MSTTVKRTAAAVSDTAAAISTQNASFNPSRTITKAFNGELSEALTWEALTRELTAEQFLKLDTETRLHMIETYCNTIRLITGLEMG